MTFCDAWEIGGVQLESRLFLGTSRYPSLEIMSSSIIKSGAHVVTVSLRRESSSGGKNGRFWDFIRALPVRVLPNTAGCFSAQEAVTTAEMARELFETDWIKLEVIGNDETLQPDPFGLVEAARILVKKGFQVFPYTTDDLVVCQRLIDVGCRILMPWGAPIGTGRGLINPEALRLLRAKFPHVPMIIDAGLGRPSHASHAMELGCDAVLLNTAVATAANPELMASAFAKAVEAGRKGYLAGLMEERSRAVASTPADGRAFFDFEARTGDLLV